ncbi:MULTISPECIES: DUF3168 domain-containing protein [unclassified Caballeronia]|uniref:tail completion protein gp17 n=1 Tax=unclassified Caballeronia TaxID=2646786 RepID=UPI002027A76C|nr:MULTISPECIES: DUF3168 domain-containing protein [unclassified Caballeronia]
MSAGKIVRNALARLADGRVFEDVVDDDVSPPWIVYQVAGGRFPVGLSGKPLGVVRARVQISVWDTTSDGRTKLMHQVVWAIVNPTVGAVPLGAPEDVFERETRLFGSHLDVSIWSKF